MPSTKRWGGLRPAPYNPNARDADHDGMVQEGTVWERPGGTKYVSAAGREIAAAISRAMPGSYIADADGNRVDYTPAGQRPGGVPDSPDVRIPSLRDLGHHPIGETNLSIGSLVGTIEGPPEVLEPDRRDVIVDAPEVDDKFVVFDEPMRVADVLVDVDNPKPTEELVSSLEGISDEAIKGVDADVPLGGQLADRALHEYQNGEFVSINKKLRAGEEIGDEDRAKLDALTAGVEATVAEEDYTVYRGLKVVDFLPEGTEDEDVDDAIKSLIGTRISDDGFLSTTVDPEAAEMYGVSRDELEGDKFTASFDEDYIVMRIDVPEGTKGVYRNTRWDEQEVVMLPGQEFELAGVTVVRDPKNLGDYDATAYIFDMRAVDSTPEVVDEVDADLVVEFLLGKEPGNPDVLRVDADRAFEEADVEFHDRYTGLDDANTGFVIGEYVDGTWGEEVNDALRGPPEERISPESGEDLFEILDRPRIDAVDGLIDATSASEPYTTYRGVGGDMFFDKVGKRPIPRSDEEVLAKLESLVGETISDKGYLSTSVSAEEAVGFAEATKNPVVIRIAVPEGGKGLYIANRYGYEHEQEVLLPRDSELKVTGVSAFPGSVLPDETIYVLDVEAVRAVDGTPEVLEDAPALHAGEYGNSRAYYDNTTRFRELNSASPEEIMALFESGEAARKFDIFAGANDDDIDSMRRLVSAHTGKNAIDPKARNLPGQFVAWRSLDDGESINAEVHLSRPLDGEYEPVIVNRDDILADLNSFRGMGEDQIMLVRTAGLAPYGGDVEAAAAPRLLEIDETTDIRNYLNAGYPHSRVALERELKNWTSGYGSAPLVRYSHSPQGVNPQLRSGDVSAETGRLISSLDELIGQAKTGQDHHVYRGLTAESLIGDIPEDDIGDTLLALVGGTVSDSGFLSTTTSEGRAVSFLTGMDSEGRPKPDVPGIMMRILVPEGDTGGAYIQSKFQEKEMLYGRDTNLRVKDVRVLNNPRGHDKPVYVLDMEMVPGGTPAPVPVRREIHDIGDSGNLKGFLMEGEIGDPTVLAESADRAVSAANVSFHDGYEDREMSGVDLLADYANEWAAGVNIGLRDYKDLADWPGGKEQFEELDRPRIEALDAIIDASPAEEAYTAYRGLSGEELLLDGPRVGKSFEEVHEEIVEKMESLVGETISDSGYLSTSVSAPEAARFADFSGTTPLVLRIAVPEGGKGIYLGDKYGAVGEGEVLLPRDAKLRVTGVSATTNEPKIVGGRTIKQWPTYVMDVEVVPDETPSPKRAPRQAGELVTPDGSSIAPDSMPSLTEPSYSNYGQFADNADFNAKYAAAADVDRPALLSAVKEQEDAHVAAMKEHRRNKAIVEAAELTIEFPEPRDTPPMTVMTSTDADLKIEGKAVKNGVKVEDSMGKFSLDLSESGISRRIDSLTTQISDDFGIDVDEVIFELEWDKWHELGITADHVGALAFYKDGKIYVSPSVARDLGSSDPETYVYGVRVLSHELGHAASGAVKNDLLNTGLRPIAEEAGAEISSISYAKRRFNQELLDASTKRMPGVDGPLDYGGVKALYLDAGYPERVEETVLQGVRRNGWDREAVLADIMHTFTEGDPMDVLYEDGKVVRVFPQNIGGRGSQDDPMAVARWSSIWREAPEDIMEPYIDIDASAAYAADQAVVGEAHLTEQDWVERQVRVAALLYWLMEEQK